MLRLGWVIFLLCVALGCFVALRKPPEQLEGFRFTFPDKRVLQARAPRFDQKWLLYGDLLIPAGSSQSRVWKNRTVVYEFAPDLPESLQKNALAAMRVWSNASVIQFVRRSTQPDYVEIGSRRDACFAATGFHGGVQPLNLGASCSFFQVMHQFGHALGLQHNHASHIGHQVVRNLYR
jgi:hypothetical protein